MIKLISSVTSFVGVAHDDIYACDSSIGSQILLQIDSDGLSWQDSVGV